MTVKLPLRLPDREPVSSDPPSEREWLQRAIRCIEHQGGDRRGMVAESAVDASSWAPAIAACRHIRTGRLERLYVAGRPQTRAGWLPEHLRLVPLTELRTRLDALDTPQDNP